MVYFFQFLTMDDKTKLRDLNNRFAAVIAERFDIWAEAHGVAANSENLIKFLIGSSFISLKNINRFTVIDSYSKILEAADGRKERAIYTLEDIVYIKSTQIKSVLKYYSTKFRFNKNLLE